MDGKKFLKSFELSCSDDFNLRKTAYLSAQKILYISIVLYNEYSESHNLVFSDGLFSFFSGENW